MLSLKHDFYTIIFKIEHKLYIAFRVSPPPREKFWVQTCINLFAGLHAYIAYILQLIKRTLTDDTDKQKHKNRAPQHNTHPIHVRRITSPHPAVRVHGAGNRTDMSAGQDTHTVRRNRQVCVLSSTSINPLKTKRICFI
jgi:hypothetical protein